jgi:hypothetical protein
VPHAGLFPPAEHSSGLLRLLLPPPRAGHPPPPSPHPHRQEAPRGPVRSQAHGRHGAVGREPGSCVRMRGRAGWMSHADNRALLQRADNAASPYASRNGDALPSPLRPQQLSRSWASNPENRLWRCERT